MTAVPATLLGVHDALASGKYEILHFSAHSSHALGTPSQWKLYLEDHEELTPEDPRRFPRGARPERLRSIGLAGPRLASSWFSMEGGAG